MYGCLIKGLRTLGLWPGPIHSSNVHASLTQIMKKLRSMECFALESKYRTAHVECGFKDNLRVKIGLIELYMPSGIDGPLRKHMKEQAKK